MEAEDAEVYNLERGHQPLQENEIAQVRAVLGGLGNLENTINDLQRDQTLMLESVTKFANRTEHRQQENMTEIRANQELLQQVIEQLQHYAKHTESRETTQEAVITQLKEEVAALRSQVQELEFNKLSTTKPAASTVSLNIEEDTGVEWDVFGPTPLNAPGFDNSELELRVTKCHKQRETPIYGGEPNEDIEVYVLNMIKWYAAYGLYFRNDLVDLRVGELMMNHTKGKAKSWFLQEYQGEQRWSQIIRKMKQRFVTKSRQEDLVAQFFDCVQGSRQLDAYNDEFRRLARTAGVSEYIKILRYKQGLSSSQLLHLLKTKSFETLDELIEASRTLNPKDVTRANEKSSKTNKTAPAKAEKKSDTAKCSATRCAETGHAKEHCWMLHPELQPKWLKEKKKGKGASAITKTTSGTEDKALWAVLTEIKSDLAKLKGDLN